MMKKIYEEIALAKDQNRKLLAILLDPDKVEMDNLSVLIDRIIKSPATHVFVGGSIVKTDKMDELVLYLKEKLALPILLFPGNPSQISVLADGILFLSLLSGRNPEYLIEHHISSVPILKNTNLEIIPTGYVLIESGTITAVERVSQTKPLGRTNLSLVCHTAKAGEYLGNKLIYLEAGSGAKLRVPLEMITAVSREVSIPLVVGGGIRSQKEIQQAFNAGADLVVIGTAFENDGNFFNHD
jgi:putative glycerol-1-phosphate prenyltransferase